ncbi:MAG TPA: UDP-N-acetylmuramoyl-L-alanine--D-glutamate ligase [Candidatus Acidoferrum sp.]|nr:UDP-N-acetylmuramoyl-L-alanine--D-glutamate ligase [Candidatus Acidoferrum sp.]
MSKIAIVGFGIEGQSAYRYFARHGHDITIFDAKTVEVPEGAKAEFGPDIYDHLNGFDMVIRTPGLRPDRIKTDAEVSSVTREFFKHCPAPIIGVTGTKGKGTTSTLIYKILQAAGKTAHLLGNIGVPALDELDNVKADDIVVYELSSFQLWDLDRSPHVAVVLMIESEHMDVHTDLNEYLNAKARIVEYQTPEDVTVYLPTNYHTADIAMRGDGRKIPYTQEPGAYVEGGWILIDDHAIIATKKLQLPGRHNIDNACAAVTAAWQITQDTAAMAKALEEFEGLDHRLKLVGEVEGVRYYDDSFATIPGSAIVALRAFEQPKIIILGGSDKGADFTQLGQEIARQNVRTAILIGLMRDRLKEALTAAGFTKIELFDEQSTMPQIVAKAKAIAQPGDVVLLSPACASFDMFKNYKDRGEQFTAAVKTLA